MAKKKKRRKKRAGRRKKSRRKGGHIPLKILERRLSKLGAIVRKRGGISRH